MSKLNTVTENNDLKDKELQPENKVDDSAEVNKNTLAENNPADESEENKDTVAQTNSAESGDTDAESVPPEENNTSESSLDDASSDNSGPEENISNETANRENNNSGKNSGIKITTKIFLSRSIFYLIFLGIVCNVSFPDMLRFFASIGVVLFMLISNFFLFKFEGMPDLIKKYLRLSFSFLDTGVSSLVIFLSGTSFNILILSFPILTFCFGLFGTGFQLILVFLVNTFFYALSGIAFSEMGITSFDIKEGVFFNISVMIWIILFFYSVQWIKKTTFVRVTIIKSIENAIEKLPPVFVAKLQNIMQAEKFQAMEYEFRKKIMSLVEIINSQEDQISFFKKNLHSNDREEDTDEMDSAIKEINSLLEIENLSLKENNRKLMELNKSLEERVKVLTQELEISNTELERIYSSMNENSDNQPIGDESPNPPEES